MAENLDNWTCVVRTRSRRSLQDAELVLTAVGIDTRVTRNLWEWRLFTIDAMAATARRHLELYEVENRKLPVTSPLVKPIDNGYRGVVAYLSVIWFFWVLEFLGIQNRTIDGGVMHAFAVQRGEWWLTITALTLHANLAHIAANSVFGSLFGMIAGRYLGSYCAWFLILLSGGFANFINASFQAGSFRALGASTAAFAAAGLVAGYSWRSTYIEGAGFRMNFLPIAAAIGIFVLTGIGGENTDVFGHILGLAVGLLVGVAIGRIDMRLLGKSGQTLSGVLALLLLVTSWYFVI